MNVSIVIPVLNSPEIVRRQLLHFAKIGLNDLDDVELILLDDGSEPPLEVKDCPLRNFRLVATHDYRPWTSSLARNRGVRLAQGRNLILIDVDHIVPRRAIDQARTFTGDRTAFSQRFGILDEDGEFRDDAETLIAWGLPAARLAARGTFMSIHPNMFLMRRELFLAMGGYREDLVERPYPQGEDRGFKRTFTEWVAAGKATDSRLRPLIYMFPSGQYCGHVDYNPFGLFHTLSRDTTANPWRRGHRFTRA